MEQGSAWAWRVDGGLDCPLFSTCLSIRTKFQFSSFSQNQYKPKLYKYNKIKLHVYIVHV